jgi:hypothetical protein
LFDPTPKTCLEAGKVIKTILKQLVLWLAKPRPSLNGHANTKENQPTCCIKDKNFHFPLCRLVKMNVPNGNRQMLA